MEMDVTCFCEILDGLLREENCLTIIDEHIRDGIKSCLKVVEKPVTAQHPNVEEVPDNLIQEIVDALKKAEIAIAESKSATQKASDTKKRSIMKLETSRRKVDFLKANTGNSSKRLPKQTNVSVKLRSSICSARARPNIRFDAEEPKLQRRAKAWLAVPIAGDNPGITSTCGNTNSTFPGFSPSSVHDLKSAIEFHVESATTPSIVVSPTVSERLKQVFSLSKSIERFAEEACLQKDDSSRQEFLAFCESLRNYDETDPRAIRLFLSINLPKLVSFANEFIQIVDVIDWDVAAPSQIEWRNQMLENFNTLFDIVEYIESLYLEKPSPEVKVNDKVQLTDSVPSVDVIWKAYVCSGKKLPQVEAPSRCFCLSLGPAVFSNHPDVYKDFEEMVWSWSDIFELQTRLQVLDCTEKRLPFWLKMIAAQPNEKASTLRLLCRIACDCFPVTMEK